MAFSFYLVFSITVTYFHQYMRIYVCLTIVILNTFLSQQFPYPKYTENFFIATVEGLLPLLMTLAFMYSAMSVIKVSDIVTNYT